MLYLNKRKVHLLKRGKLIILQRKILPGKARYSSMQSKIMQAKLFLLFGFLCLTGPVHSQNLTASWEETFNEGVLLLAEGSYQKALEQFEQVLVAFPSHALTHYYIGKTYTALGDYEKALAVYKEALRLDSSLVEAYPDMGICLYQMGRYQEALKIFTLAEQLRVPDQATVLFYSGLASYQIGNYVDCKRFMERCREVDPDFEFVCRYYEGLTDAYLGRYSSARRELTSLLTVHQQPVREAAADSLKILETGGKPFRFSFEFGLEYDDNVILQPEAEPLPSEVSNQGDWRLVTQASFLYRKEFRMSELTISSSLYHCFHSQLSSYDLTGSSSSLVISSNSNTFQPTLEYKYDYYSVGSEKYLDRHSISTSATIPSGYSFKSQFFLSIETTCFFQPSLVPADSRDSTAYLYGVKFSMPFSGDGFFSFGAAYKLNNAEGANWDYHSPQTWLQLTMPLGHSRNTLSLSGTFEHLDFDHVNSLFGSVRDDNRLTLKSSIVFRLNKNWNLSIGHTYIHNNPTLHAYEYERNISSIFASCMF